MKRDKIILALAIATLSTSAHASTATIPKPIGGVKPSNPAGLGVQIAINTILAGVGWIMEEGTKTEKIPDPASGSGSTTGTGTGTIAGSVSGTISTPSQAQTYPFEYWFAGEKFSSAESACQYAFSGYLSKNKLKKSRRPDGTYLEKTNIYIGSSGYFHHSVPGYFTCNTHAAGVNDTSCGKSNICGSHYSWSGSMHYVGTEKTTTTTVSDDYKERREKARQAVEQAIANAQTGTGATTAPNTTTDRPKTGTTTGTGIGELANPVYSDTTGTNVGDGTTTGDTTATNNKTTTNTNVKTEPFSLPTFCGWASTICDFVEWFKAEPPQEQEPKKVPKATLGDLGLDESELFKQRVNFNGQCPKHELKFTVMGKAIIEPMPMYHFCNLLEQLAPWLLAFSYLSSGFFVIRNL